MKLKLIKYHESYRDQVFSELVPQKYFIKYTTKSLFYKILKSLKIYSNYFLLLSNDNNDIMGCILLRKKLSPIKMKIEWFIYGVAISTKYRGQGYGNILINETINWCREKKVKEIFLLVEKDNNPALNLYKKNEFKTLPLDGLKALRIKRKKSNIVMLKQF